MQRDQFDTNRRGILNPRAGEAAYELARFRPLPAFDGWIDLHWQVEWDLSGHAPYEQETLPPPCVNLVFGTHRAGLHGPVTSRFVARLEGKGWVFGTKFAAGTFRAYLDAPVSSLTDRVITPWELFGDRGRDLDRDVRAEVNPERRRRLVADFLGGIATRLDPDAERARDIVEMVRRDREVTRVDAVAERAGLSVRALQRLFDEHVGVSPKSVIQRFRVQEAADLVASGRVPDWARLAQDLGYVDQSHFIRDFKSQVGRTPAEYCASCAASTLPHDRAG